MAHHSKRTLSVTKSSSNRSLRPLPPHARVVRSSDQGPLMSSSVMTGNRSEAPCFYISADTSRGWPRESNTTLCKFGVTGRKPEDRCKENEAALREEWGIEADLELVFIATGQITTAEKEIADYTTPWLPSRFQENAEWRRCPPRELARIAILVAEDRQR